MYRSPFSYSKQNFGRSVSSPSIRKQGYVAHKSPLTSDRFVSGANKSPFKSPLRENMNGTNETIRSKSPSRAHSPMRSPIRSPMKSPLKSPSTPNIIEPMATDVILDAPYVSPTDYPKKLVDISDENILAVAISKAVYLLRIESTEEEEARNRRREEPPEAIEVPLVQYDQYGDEVENDIPIDALCWTRVGLVISRDGRLDVVYPRMDPKPLFEDPNGRSCLVMSNIGKRLATGWSDGTIRIFDTIKKEVWETCEHRHRITSIAWNTEGTQLASGDSRGNVVIISLSSENKRFSLHCPITGITWSDCNTFYVSALNNEGTVLRFRISNSPEPIAPIAEVDTGAPVFGLNWNDKWGLCVAHKSDNPNNWEIYTKHFINIGRFSGHTRDIITIASSADQDTIVTISDDETLRLWKLRPKAKPGISPSIRRSASPFGSSPFLR